MKRIALICPTDMRSLILLAIAAASLRAQWLNYPDSRTPRTKDGKPILTAPAPRMNGKPDLSGVWQTEPVPESERSRLFGAFAESLASDLQFVSIYAMNLLRDLQPQAAPIRPEAEAIMRQRGQSFGKDIPTSHCLPGGVPFSTLIAPFKMIQTPIEIVMLLEDNNPPRQIYLDGRKLPTDPDPSWMGYSSGSWQGDTLVVETIGFNDRSWLDGTGHPRSESMHITERFRRRDFGHMELEMSFDDPKYYTRTFNVKLAFKLIPDSDVLESVCSENEKDRSHLDVR